MLKINSTRNYSFIISFLTIWICCFSAQQLGAANRYWVASSSSNWNNSSNWSTYSGGSGGASVPGSYDVAYFTAARNGNCNINTAVNVRGINIAGYSGCISQGSYTITIGSYNYTQSSGTFNGGTASLDLNGHFKLSGGSFKAPTAIFYVSGYWTHTSGGAFNHNFGTVSFDGNTATYNVNVSESFNHVIVNKKSSYYYLTVTSGDVLVVNGNLTLKGGSITNSSGVVDLRGNFKQHSSSGAAYTTLHFTGSADQILDANGAVSWYNGPVVINKSGGKVKLHSNFTMNYHYGQHLTLTSGKLYLNGYTLTNSRSNTYCNGSFILEGSGTLDNMGWIQNTAAAEFTITGTSTFKTGSGNFNQSNGSFTSLAALVDINGHFILSGGTFNAPSGNMYVSNYWTHTSGGTFNHNNGTVTFDGYTATFNVNASEKFYHVILNKKSSYYYFTISSGDILLVEGNLTVIGGSFTASSGTLEVRGNYKQYSTSGACYTTLKFTGSANQDFDMNGAETWYNGPIIINKSAGKVTLKSNLTMDYDYNQSLTFTSGKLDLNGKTLSVTRGNTICNGNFILDGTGTLDNMGWVQSIAAAEFTITGAITFKTGSGNFNQSNGTFTSLASVVDINGHFKLSGGTFNAPSGHMYVSNYWTHTSGGTFNHNGGTVTFDGYTATFNVNASETFHHVILNKKSSYYYFTITSGDILLVEGNLTVKGGSFTASSGTLEVRGNYKQYSTSGACYTTLKFTGTANQEFDMSGAETWYNGPIIINKSAGKVTLKSNLTMDYDYNQSLTFTSGKLDLNGKTLSVTRGNTICNGNFILDGTGTLDNMGWVQSIAAAEFTITGAITFKTGSGNFNQSNGTFTSLASVVDINGHFKLSGGTFNAPSGHMYVSNYWTHTSGGTFNHNGGTVTFDGYTATFNVNASETFHHVILNKKSSYYYFTITSGDILLVEGNLTVKGGSFTASSGTLEVRGNYKQYSTSGACYTTLKFTGSNNQEFDLSGASTWYKGTIIVDKTTGRVDLKSNLVVNYSSQSLKIYSGTFDLNGYSLTAPKDSSGGIFIIKNDGNLQLKGYESVSGPPIIKDCGTVTYDGTGNSYTMKNWSYKSLAVNGGSTTQFFLPAHLTIACKLKLYSGIISTASYTLYINSSGEVCRTGGHVKGNYKKYIPGGASSVTFEIGDATQYAPVSLAFSQVTVAGDLLVSTTAGDHYQISSSLLLNSSTSVNRYWTLTNCGISFTSYNATFSFTSADLDGGVNPNSLIIGRYESNSWTYPTVGTTTSTSTQGTGITGFGDFQLAQGAGKFWDGGANTCYWGDAANWNPNGVPTSSDDITLINANTIKVNVSAVCNNLVLSNPGLALTILSGKSLTVSGNLTLGSGTLNTESTFPMVYGTVSLLGGTVGYTLYGNQIVSAQNYPNLTISGSGTKSLAGNITISGNLTVASGILDLVCYTANNPSATTTVNANPLTSGGYNYSKKVYTTASINPSANKLILLAIGRRGSGAISSVSGNGLTWVKVASDYTGYGEGYDGVLLYRAMGSNPNSGPITITFASAQSRASWSVVEFGNVDVSGTHGSNAIVQHTTSNTKAATSLTAWLCNFSAANNATYAVAAAANNTLTAGSGFSQLHKVAFGSSCTPQLSILTEWKATNSKTPSVNFNYSAATIIGIEIRSLGGTMTIANGARLKIDCTTALPLFNTHIIGSSSIIEYYGGAQTVATLNSGQHYGHLVISGYGIKKLEGHTKVRGNLTITNGANLTVDPGQYLTVNGTLELFGNECLVLKSDYTGKSASLLDGGVMYGSGTVRYERYFTKEKWHYFSTPVDDASSSNFWGAALYIYNATESEWQAIGPNVTLEKMTGYDVYYHNNTTVSVSGKTYTGYHAVNLVNNSNGYNFVGNPYPSAINWNSSSGWTKTNIDQAVYAWNPGCNGVSSYVNGIGTNGASSYIAPSQGFFVTVKNTGPYLLGMNNEVRCHNPVKFRSDDSRSNTLKVKLDYAESSDETAISFSENASVVFDGDYDAYKVEESDPVRTIIYSKTIDGVDLSINTLPESHRDKSIPLYLSSGAAGSKEFSVSGLESFDYDVDIFLEDLKLGLVVDMKNDPYSFHYEPLDENNRFILHFALPAAISSSTEEIGNEAKQMDVNKINSFISSGDLIIDLSHMQDSRTDVYVFNTLGKLMTYKKFNSNGLERVELDATAGYYLVKIVSGTEIYTKKVLNPYSTQ